MILVYLSESSLRRNESGITMSLDSGQKSGGRGMDCTTGSHEGSDPEMSVQEIVGSRSVCEAADHARHQVADNNEIADANPKALDGYSGVKNNGGVGIGDLTQSKETGRATVEISGASGLQIEAKAGRQAGPDNNDDTEEDAHVGEGRGHGQDAGTDNGVDEVDDAAEPAGVAVLAILLAVFGTARHGRGAVWTRRRVAVRRVD